MENQKFSDDFRKNKTYLICLFYLLFKANIGGNPLLNLQQFKNENRLNSL